MTDWQEVVKRIEFDFLAPMDFTKVVIHTLDAESGPEAINYLGHHLPNYLSCLKDFGTTIFPDELEKDAAQDPFFSHAVDADGKLTPEFRRGMAFLRSYFEMNEGVR